MARPDEPLDRARHLRDVAEHEVTSLPEGEVPTGALTAHSAKASALAQIATVDVLLVVVEELRQARGQERREARKDRRERRRG